ncbi:MAG: hypothetical protein JWR11_4233, partial [Mycobacterium sp.]|nr:hypothetical protein [Mycobacterium sp.]
MSALKSDTVDALEPNIRPDCTDE